MLVKICLNHEVGLDWPREAPKIVCRSRISRSYTEFSKKTKMYRSKIVGCWSNHCVVSQKYLYGVIRMMEASSSKYSLKRIMNHLEKIFYSPAASFWRRTCWAIFYASCARRAVVQVSFAYNCCKRWTFSLRTSETRPLCVSDNPDWNT